MEDRIQDESDALLEARRARTLAEENMVAAQREAEVARQEAKVALCVGFVSGCGEG